MPEQTYIIRDTVHRQCQDEPYKLVIEDMSNTHIGATLWRWDVSEHILTRQDEWERFGSILVKWNGHTLMSFEHLELYGAYEYQAFYRAVSASVAIICGMFDIEDIELGLLIVPDGLEVEGA